MQRAINFDRSKEGPVEDPRGNSTRKGFQDGPVNPPSKLLVTSDSHAHLTVSLTRL